MLRGFGGCCQAQVLYVIDQNVQNYLITTLNMIFGVTYHLESRIMYLFLSPLPPNVNLFGWTLQNINNSTS